MEAILRRSALMNAIFISNVAVSSQGDVKAIKKAIEGFTKQNKNKKKATIKPSTTDEELFLQGADTEDSNILVLPRIEEKSESPRTST